MGGDRMRQRWPRVLAKRAFTCEPCPWTCWTRKTNEHTGKTGANGFEAPMTAGRTATRVSKVMRQVFGLAELRPGQQAVIDAVLARRHTLAIMPTGAGKSLCYQVPAMLMRV
jgi:superfamily II DNA helicase RecQ